MSDTPIPGIYSHVTEAEDRLYHQRLPMGHDEKTIAIYRHHWFAYASVFFVAVFAVTVIFGLIAVFISQGGDGNLVAQHKDSAVAGTLVFAVAILLFSLIPIWLRSQEKLILSDDSLYQTLQPSLFAGKVSQLNLAHMADVTVRNDFFGTIFGFGHITIETPGEQDNFEYYILGNAHEAAREILEAHENYTAALESGRIPTTFKGTPAHQMPNIDPQQYQEFLAFQQMKAQSAAQQQPAEAVAAANAQPPYQAENTQDDANFRVSQQ